MNLYFYKRNEFFEYKRKNAEKGIKMVSISRLLSEESIRNIPNEKFIVDVSAIASLLKDDDNIILQFERLFPLFSENVKFVADEKYQNDLSYYLRFCFDNFENLQISLPTQKKDTRIQEVESEPVKVKCIIDLNSRELNSFFKQFNSKLYGHERFKNEFKNIVNSFRIFNRIGEHKVLSIFLMGDSGVGKTEVARVIHKCLGSKKKIAKINFGNYSSHDALNTLIGSPLGYVGSDGGELMKRVLESDVGLILIDEFEKANQAVFNYFLDVLENGKITNTQAEEYDVNGYIIVFTSNISKEDFYNKISPELRSRFDYIGMFNLLTDEDKSKFVKYRLSNIVKKYNSCYSQVIDKKIYSSLIRQIDVTEYRNMRDLNKKIEDIFVQTVLSQSSSMQKIKKHNLKKKTTVKVENP
jgi:ATP-dependent Clp protease ATP-binding subunit ClpC